MVGSAKDISDIAEVPRTQVYDAVRVLESEELVEIQHTKPQRFRALSVKEATHILSNRYTDRINDLERALGEIEPHDRDDPQSAQEVWSLSGRKPVTARTNQIVADATEELILVVGSENVPIDSLYEAIDAATKRGVDVVVGAISSTTREKLREQLSDGAVFETELYWLEGSSEDDPSIEVLVMADRSTLLVSSRIEHGTGEEPSETAVFGSGFTNELVVIARRLLSRGLLKAKDPAE